MAEKVKKPGDFNIKGSWDGLVRLVDNLGYDLSSDGGIKPKSQDGSWLLPGFKQPVKPLYVVSPQNSTDLMQAKLFFLTPYGDDEVISSPLFLKLQMDFYRTLREKEKELKKKRG